MQIDDPVSSVMQEVSDRFRFAEPRSACDTERFVPRCRLQDTNKYNLNSINKKVFARASATHVLDTGFDPVHNFLRYPEAFFIKPGFERRRLMVVHAGVADDLFVAEHPLSGEVGSDSVKKFGLGGGIGDEVSPT